MTKTFAECLEEGRNPTGIGRFRTWAQVAASSKGVPHSIVRHRETKALDVVPETEAKKMNKTHDTLETHHQHHFGECLEEGTSKEDLRSFVNSHRTAVGRKPLGKEVSHKELKAHDKLIMKRAPYGNDPWDGVKESVELTEDWRKHPDGTYTADASEIQHHKSEIRCPAPSCRKSMGYGARQFMQKKRHVDSEGDVTHWSGHCPHCKTKLTIFND